jgi:hypothetical protein
MKRFFILLALLCASTFAMAQKADAAFVVGGSFVSDTKETFLAPSTTLVDTVKTDNHLFLDFTKAHAGQHARHGGGSPFHTIYHTGIPA